MLDRAGQEQAEVGCRAPLLAYHFRTAGLEFRHVFGMNAASNLFVSHSADRRIESKRAVGLVRQVNAFAAGIVGIATGVA
jgi:hypothetical protein